MKKRESNTGKSIKKTWILLLVAWPVFLLPIPGTSYIAYILILGAFIMTIVTLAQGEVKHGMLQLLSIFIITPFFHLAGLIIFWVFINKSINLDNLNAYIIKNTALENYNTEIDKIKKLGNGIYSQTDNTSIVKKKENKDIIHLKYIIYLKDGGKIECEKMEINGNFIKLKNKSGILVDMDLSKVEKIDKFETINNKTSFSSWKPAVSKG